MPLQKAVFLDRDGTLNRAFTGADGKSYPPQTLDQLALLPGVAEGCAALRRAGFLLIVVTNQPDIVEGKQDPAVLAAMHARLRDWLPLDAILVATDRAADDFKPKPGMILRAAADHGIDLGRSFMLGDRWRDVGAGKAAGVTTLYFDHGGDEGLKGTVPDVTIRSFAEAVAVILRLDRQSLQGLADGASFSGETLMTEPLAPADLKLKIFADGADLAGMKEMYANPVIKGFTTNPTLMRKAGITDYKAFAGEVLAAIPDRPISFEVFADEIAEMEVQALEIASWSETVNVKIPITNTRRESTAALVGRLSRRGVVVNVTAIFTLAQIEEIVAELDADTPAILSVFAGRIADTGRDPMPILRAMKAAMASKPKAELLWASPRELLNVYQAEEVGCQIITATNDILKKLALVGKDLADYSLETVEMFYKDASAAGYRIDAAV